MCSQGETLSGSVQYVVATMISCVSCVCVCVCVFFWHVDGILCFLSTFIGFQKNKKPECVKQFPELVGSSEGMGR